MVNFRWDGDEKKETLYLVTFCMHISNKYVIYTFYETVLIKTDEKCEHLNLREVLLNRWWR